MDIGTSAAVIAGITVVGKHTAEVVKDFVTRVFGPSADAAGVVLAHPIVVWQERRVERASRTLVDAAEIALHAGDLPADFRTS